MDLKKAAEFHGHLGPFLVLGLRAGELAMENLKAKKYFGIEVTIHCPAEPPERCFVDGIQLSTGATYGKANIRIEQSNEVNAVFLNKESHKSFHLSLNTALYEYLKTLTLNDDLESISQKLASEPFEKVFSISEIK